MPINPDRIKLMDAPWYTPRVDIYDKDPDGPVVQMGITLKNFTGDVYIKAEHLEYIAREVLGMKTDEQYLDLSVANAEKDTEIVALKEELESLKRENSEHFNQRIDSLIADYASSRGIENVVPPVAFNKTNKSDKATGDSSKADKDRKTKDISLFDE